MIEVCVNNNARDSFEWPCPEGVSRPKRNFRFQVIEVAQGPKWFIWPSRNGSNEEIDANHNEEVKSEAPFAAVTSTQNGYGTLRRSVLRGSKRKPGDSEVAPRTASEPAPRRVSLKKDKAATEPLGPANSTSTFKILSVAKKWESFDVEEEENSECIEEVSTDRRWTAH